MRVRDDEALPERLTTALGGRDTISRGIDPAMPRLSADRAGVLVERVLVSCGAFVGNARSVASALVGAELIGQAGHGLCRLPTYAAQVASGKVDGRALPTVDNPRPALALIDAADGFAFPALDLAVDILPALARETGVAAASIRRSHHAGALGLFVERIAESGCGVLALANTPAAIAPWGAGEPLFGTNPIAFAMPAADQRPIVVDLSLSTAARGKVLSARQRDEAIPMGWALDHRGENTTDPEKALEGSMLPIGNAKGAVLAMAVELLAVGLAGGRFGWEASSFFAAEGEASGTGQLLIAFDPTAFGSHAEERAAALVERVEGSGGRVPGRRRQALRERITSEGIHLGASFDREMMAFAAVAPAWERIRADFRWDAEQ